MRTPLKNYLIITLCCVLFCGCTRASNINDDTNTEYHGIEAINKVIDISSRLERNDELQIEMDSKLGRYIDKLYRKKNKAQIVAEKHDCSEMSTLYSGSNSTDNFEAYLNNEDGTVYVIDVVDSKTYIFAEDDAIRLVNEYIRIGNNL